MLLVAGLCVLIVVMFALLMRRRSSMINEYLKQTIKNMTNNDLRRGISTLAETVPVGANRATREKILANAWKKLTNV